MPIGEPPLVRRRRILPAIRYVDMAGIDGGKFRDHGSASVKQVVAEILRRTDRIFAIIAVNIQP
jgi:hypothetical protein